MQFTHLVLILVNDYKSFIKISTVDFRTFDRFKYNEYNKEQSIILTCSNALQARNLKSAFEAILLHDLSKDQSIQAYILSAMPKLIELIDLYKKHLNSISLKTFDNIKEFDFNKPDFLYFSLNFYKIFTEILRQIDEEIKQGAIFERVKKTGLKSIIYNRNLKILDEFKANWAYNEGNNIVIDYTGLIEWKAAGVYPTHRRLVEMKYFL